jgi:H+-translocating NAD(P) transhydrogenase subunit alpha
VKERPVNPVLAVDSYRHTASAVPKERAKKEYGASAPEDHMNSNLIDALFIFMLACFIGFEVIRHVSPLLHTPLMSLTNALDAIAVVGAIVLVGERKSEFATVLGVIAIVAATSNVVGGFLITDRMLKMFKSSRPNK